LDFAFKSTLIARTSASIVYSCSYDRAFATDFFPLSRLAAPVLSFTTVAVTASGHFVSSD
jgi:hypothetical protein